VQNLLSKLATRWYWLAIAALVVFFLMSVRSGNRDKLEMELIRDSLITTRTDLKASQGLVGTIRLEKASEVAEKQRYYDEIIRLNNLRPPTRSYKPVIINVHDTISVVAGVDELQLQVKTLTDDNVRLTQLADATLVQIDSVKSVDRRSEAQLMDRIDSLEVKLADASHKVDVAIKATKRPWYKKTWTVIKATGERAGIFTAGVFTGQHIR
jgi:hypothetical protein